MKFTADKSELLTALSRCLSVADQRSPDPRLVNVYLQAFKKTHGPEILHIEATDIMRSVASRVSASVDDDGSICLPAKDLYDRVKLLPEGTIAVSTEGTKATIKTVGNSRRFTMHGIPGDEFPSVPEPPTVSDGAIKIASAELARLFGRVHHAISTDTSRLALSSMLLEAGDAGVRVVGMDGHRLCVAVNASDPKGQPWLIPIAAVSDLRRLFDSDAPVVVSQHKGTLFVEFPDYTFSVKLTDTEFPPWRQVMPTNYARTVTVERAALTSALRAVSLSSGLKTGCVAFTFAAGILRLHAESPTAGDGFDEIASDYKGETIHVGFNSKYMLDALAAIDAEQITISTNGELDPALVRAADRDDLLAIVMPLRVQ